MIYVQDMASKYVWGSFSAGFAIPCKDIASKYDLMQEYAVHVRRILATEVFQPYLEPIFQHETGKQCRMQRYCL